MDFFWYSGILVSGIILLQAGLLLSGQDVMMVLTVTPLTVFFPAIIGIHILSGSGFVRTGAVWGTGLLVSGVLFFLKKNFQRAGNILGQGTYTPEFWMQMVCFLLIAALLLFVIFRYISKPFKKEILQNQADWLPVFFSFVMLILIFSYFKNSPTSTAAAILLFLTVLSVLLVLARMFIYAANNRRMRELEKELEIQMEIQRREYENICKKMELGRTYRHDARHHLTVLKGLADKEENEELTQYIDSLGGQLQATEQESWCENRVANTVLASYISRAKESGCTVTAKIRIPADIPFDSLDICAILGNALENAFHACRDNESADNVWIHLTAVLEDNRKFIISIENPCEARLQFDRNGVPVSSKKDGHGIGLKSIRAITEKYNGIFQCICDENIFRLNVVLFRSEAMAPARKAEFIPRKVFASIALVFFCCCLAVNCLPAAAQELEKIPGLGTFIRIVDVKNYNTGWGSSNFSAVIPNVELVEYAEDGLLKTQPFESKIENNVSKIKNTGSKIKLADSYKKKEEISGPPADANEKESVTVESPSGSISWESGSEMGTPEIPSVIVTVPEISDQEQSSAGNESGQNGQGSDNSESSTAGDSSNEGKTDEDISEGVDDINRKMEEYVNEMREKFLWYLARKYEGYAGMDITYNILRNDNSLLLLRFDATLNVGGSGQYSRCFMLDKRTGRNLGLGDLFAENSDYIGTISAEITRQMTELMNAEQGLYFIPGTFWADSECFYAIAADQNFYINDDNQLVIVFDEYEVAPGSAGMPEFIITTDIMGGILQQPSLLN